MISPLQDQKVERLTTIILEPLLVIIITMLLITIFNQKIISLSPKNNLF